MIDPGSVLYVSAASIWEIAIKASLAKVDLGGVDLLDELAADRALELPVSGRHALEAAALPPVHQDPFDRMLAAQALVEGLVCVTRDPAFAAYGVPTLW